jgi:hypothetical protein
VITGGGSGARLRTLLADNGEYLLASSVRWDDQIARKHPSTEMAVEKNRMHVPPAKSRALVKNLGNTQVHRDPPSEVKKGAGSWFSRPAKASTLAETRRANASMLFTSC